MRSVGFRDMAVVKLEEVELFYLPQGRLTGMHG